MRLYLIRHGIAIDHTDPKCPAEPERMLTKKGRERTQEVARGLAKLGIQPTAFYSSPYVRTMETAEIFAEELTFPIIKIRRTEALLSDAAPSEFMKLLIKERPTEACCFGHAPHLDNFIAHVLGVRHTVTALKKAGAACIELEDLKKPHGWLVWLNEPKQFRK